MPGIAAAYLLALSDATGHSDPRGLALAMLDLNLSRGKASTAILPKEKTRGDQPNQGDPADSNGVVFDLYGYMMVNKMWIEYIIYGPLSLDKLCEYALLI